jgi:hypothetical protein
MTTDASQLVRFYEHRGTDDRNRTLAEILGWDDDRIEGVHDFIQWLFPLPEPSPFNAGAPVLSARDVAAFTASDNVRKTLRLAFVRILAFYGFAAREEEGAPITVCPGPDFAGRSRRWLTPGNHNLLRITRILRSISLLGLAPEAAAFLAALERLRGEPRAAHVIGNVTICYWRRGVTDPGQR